MQRPCWEQPLPLRKAKLLPFPEPKATDAMLRADAAEKYAEKLGLAFQIRDDILDCTANEKIFGKPVGSDEKNGKTTFVTLYGLESAQSEAERLTEKALRQLKIFGEEAEMLKELTEYLLDRKY